MINWRHPKTVLKKCIQLRRAARKNVYLLLLFYMIACNCSAESRRTLLLASLAHSDVLTHICIEQFYFFCFRFVFSHVYSDFVCLPRYKMTIIEGTLLSMIVEGEAAYQVTVQQLYREDIPPTTLCWTVLASLCLWSCMPFFLSFVFFCINPLILNHFRINHDQVRREFLWRR